MCELLERILAIVLMAQGGFMGRGERSWIGKNDESVSLLRTAFPWQLNGISLAVESDEVK